MVIYTLNSVCDDDDDDGDGDDDVDDDEDDARSAVKLYFDEKKVAIILTYLGLLNPPKSISFPLKPKAAT